jgi:hypothetical protein
MWDGKDSVLLTTPIRYNHAKEKTPGRRSVFAYHNAAFQTWCKEWDSTQMFSVDEKSIFSFIKNDKKGQHGHLMNNTLILNPHHWGTVRCKKSGRSFFLCSLQVDYVEVYQEKLLTKIIQRLLPIQFKQHAKMLSPTGQYLQRMH